MSYRACALSPICSSLIYILYCSFDESTGKVLQFPKSEDCHTVYCNIEGIHWMNEEMLLGVSDKMKGRGKQDYRCFEKDQAIHAFVLP